MGALQRETAVHGTLSIFNSQGQSDPLPSDKPAACRHRLMTEGYGRLYDVPKATEPRFSGTAREETCATRERLARSSPTNTFNTNDGCKN